ncbi:MAG: hypothetical protein R2856_26265 [Caldilineaceae bacterium]
MGRLDYNSEGLMLLTDDGELAHKLTLPASSTPRPTTSSFRRHPPKRRSAGCARVEIEGGRTAACRRHRGHASARRSPPRQWRQERRLAAIRPAGRQEAADPSHGLGCGAYAWPPRALVIGPLTLSNLLPCRRRLTDKELRHPGIARHEEAEAAGGRASSQEVMPWCMVMLFTQTPTPPSDAPPTVAG